MDKTNNARSIHANASQIHDALALERRKRQKPRAVIVLLLSQPINYPTGLATCFSRHRSPVAAPGSWCFDARRYRRRQCRPRPPDARPPARDRGVTRVAFGVPRHSGLGDASPLSACWSTLYWPPRWAASRARAEEVRFHISTRPDHRQGCHRQIEAGIQRLFRVYGSAAQAWVEVEMRRNMLDVAEHRVSWADLRRQY